MRAYSLSASARILADSDGSQTQWFALADELAPEITDLLRRIDTLRAAGGDVLLFRKPELYHMTALVNRHTQAPVRFVAGLSLLIRAFEDVYSNLEGRLLEAFARLFAQNVRIYVYPMIAADLREWLKSASVTGWEWSETNGWVSASQLRRAPPLGHLFAYLLASNFLVPMRVPMEPSATSKLVSEFLSQSSDGFAAPQRM